jgi:hypothetical protein
VETIRRLSLTALLSITKPGTSDQSIIAILLSLFFIKLSTYFSPFTTKNNNVMAEIGSFQIFFTFFGILVVQNNLLQGGIDNRFIGILLIIINMGNIYI